MHFPKQLRVNSHLVCIFFPLEVRVTINWGDENSNQEKEMKLSTALHSVELSACCMKTAIFLPPLTFST